MNAKRWMGCCALAVAGILSACGGGSDEAEGTAMAEDAAGKVPSSATASVQAFVGFVGAQAPADRAEPLSLRGAVPPTSETAEPMEVG